MSENIETLPNGWVMATINDTGEYINGFAFKPSHRTVDGLPIVRIQNLTDESKPINRTNHEIDETYKIQDGSLLVSWSATLDAFIWRRGPAYVNQHIFKVIPEQSLIDGRLLFYWLKKAIEDLKNTEHLHGSTMKHINRGPFMAHELPIPPKDEQTRIVEKLEELLSDLDNGVAELHSAQTKLKQYRQSLLKSAVEGTLTEQWRKENASNISESGEQLLARILKERRARWEEQKEAEFKAKEKKPPKNWKEKYPEPVAPDISKLPVLPEGWVWASVMSTGDVQLGRQRSPRYHSGDNMLPYLRVANVFEDRIDTSDVMSMHFSKRDEESYRLSYGDILLNEGQSLALVGRPAIYRDELERACFTNTLIRYKPSEYVLSEYALLVFLYYMHSGRFQKIAKITTNIAHLGAGRFSEIEFPVPPIEEQKEIINDYYKISSSIKKQDDDITSGISQAEAQRKNILKEAFSGKLVPQNANDEPASELLKKIQQERAEGAKQPKPKRTKKAVKVVTMESLEQVLQKQDDWIDAQEAFKACGVTDGTDTDCIEELYAELRKLDKAGRLDVERHGDYDKIKLKSE